MRTQKSKKNIIDQAKVLADVTYLESNPQLCLLIADKIEDLKNDGLRNNEEIGKAYLKTLVNAILSTPEVEEKLILSERIDKLLSEGILGN
jgi:hypothetical protein